MNFDEMRRLLKSRLKPKRYEHSLGVASEAVRLAGRFGVDEGLARVSGLLHDCAREMEASDMPMEAVRRGIPYGKVERAMPLLLHAPLGVHIARETYGVTDEAVLSAILRHTVGGEGMTPLDKIIYFADMIEPSRDYPEVSELRRLSREASLDDMMLAGLSRSIAFLVERGLLIHPATVAARNEILLKAENDEPDA